MFGKVLRAPQTEPTPFYPRSPYGVARSTAHLIGVNYRESYDLFGSRRADPVQPQSRAPRARVRHAQITWHAAAIKPGLAPSCALGNLDAERDWGYAKDYVEAMWLMLQQDAPDDFVIATVQTDAVRIVEVAFDQAGLTWEHLRQPSSSRSRPAWSTLLSATRPRPARSLGLALILADFVAARSG